MFSGMANRFRNSKPSKWEMEENLREIHRNAPDPSKLSYILGVSIGQGAQPSALAIVEKSILGVPMTGGKHWEKLPPRYEVRYVTRWAARTGLNVVIGELRTIMAQTELALSTVVVEADNAIKAVRMVIRQAGTGGIIKPAIIVDNLGDGWSEVDGLWKVSKPAMIETCRQLLLTNRLKFSAQDERPKVPIPTPDGITQTILAYQTSSQPGTNEVFAARREGENDDCVYAVCLPLWWGQFCERSLTVG